jgi:glycosyltransferase involved in cell wall biosynthesis
LILWLYKKKATITVSEGTQQELMSLWFHRVHVLKNTTNRPISHQIQQKEKQLLVLWRIVPNKRIDHAIKIIYELWQQWYHYTLNIVGNIQDHIEYNKLQQLSKKLWIEQQVIFHSKIEQKQVTKLLDQSEYLLLTSKKEGFWIVVLEANTRWVPAIGYNIPGVNEAISNSKNGILITDGDCASIARYIIAHQDDYHILQKSTIQYITSYPTWASNINRMEKILLSS